MTIYVQVDNMSEVQMPCLQKLGIEKSKEKFVNISERSQEKDTEDIVSFTGDRLVHNSHI